jgi:hypothetical protein
VIREAEESAGWHDVSWDGKDQGGRPLVSGVYFARLLTRGRGAAVERLIVAR